MAMASAYVPALSAPVSRDANLLIATSEMLRQYEARGPACTGCGTARSGHEKTATRAAARTRNGWLVGLIAPRKSAGVGGIRGHRDRRSPGRCVTGHRN